MGVQTSSISTAFIWRRVHSLTGFWLVLYLILHLVTNSQAALWIGDDGSVFVKMVNSLESLPFLQVIETVLIGIPLAVHGVWGIKRALAARTNSGSGDGSSPSLKYDRNRAFTWQRLSSWILLFGILGHVAQMRFLDAPVEVKSESGVEYQVSLTFDEGLSTLSKRLHVTLTDSGGKVIARAGTPGTAFLLMVRDTFKSPLMAILYTIFVLAAAFHAFNGFWTFLITWGVILSYRSQRAMIPYSVAGILLLSFLGLAAIWGTYWVNLRH
jgi:succinate dehydrogenase / fumarate reductase cytochrome b subunit